MPKAPDTRKFIYGTYKVRSHQADLSRARNRPTPDQRCARSNLGLQALRSGVTHPSSISRSRFRNRQPMRMCRRRKASYLRSGITLTHVPAKPNAGRTLIIGLSMNRTTTDAQTYKLDEGCEIRIRGSAGRWVFALPVSCSPAQTESERKYGLHPSHPELYSDNSTSGRYRRSRRGGGDPVRYGLR